jgi:hypothetical protein
MTESNVSERDVFVNELPVYELMGMNYHVKPASSFSFNDMVVLGRIQDEAGEMLQQAKDEGSVTEDGEIDTSVAKYAIAGLELNLKRIGIHLQDALTLEELKDIPSDEIRSLEDFLSSQDEEKEEKRKVDQDKRKQKKALRQRKSG